MKPLCQHLFLIFFEHLPTPPGVLCRFADISRLLFVSIIILDSESNDCGGLFCVLPKNFDKNGKDFSKIYVMMEAQLQKEGRRDNVGGLSYDC